MKKQLLLIFCIALSPLADAMEQPESLIQSAKNGDLAGVRELIQAGIDLDQTDERDNTALIWASYKGHLPVVQALIQAGADANKQAKNGCTALMNAATESHLEIVKELIQVKNINPNIVQSTGQTALYWAVMQRGSNPAIVKELIRANIDMTIGIKHTSTTPLMWGMLAQQRNLVARILLTEISKADADRIQTIIFSFCRPDIQDMILPMTRILIEDRLERANQMMLEKNKSGRTAQKMALEINDQATAALLDPNNQASQDELRKLIRENIYEILARSPQEANGVEESKTNPWPGTIESEDPFGTWFEKSKE